MSPWSSLLLWDIHKAKMSKVVLRLCNFVFDCFPPWRTGRKKIIIHIFTTILLVVKPWAFNAESPGCLKAWFVCSNSLEMTSFLTKKEWDTRSRFLRLLGGMRLGVQCGISGIRDTGTVHLPDTYSLNVCSWTHGSCHQCTVTDGVQ